MCGRFTLTANADILRQSLELNDISVELEPRYNIAPTQPVAVVTSPDERRVELFKWGLIPSWAKDESIASKLINARAETVAEKPAFRAAFARRRCLVLADGFYEWQKLGGKGKGSSQPYYFQLREHEPFAFAGLWEVWRSPEGEKEFTCSIVTCPANERVAPVHGRNPVILRKNDIWRWLDPDAEAPELQNLLTAFPAERMESFAVSTLVNSPSHDSAELIAPLE